MATYASIFNPGLVNEEGDMKPFNRLFTGGVAIGQSSSGLLAVQRGGGANMSVDVSVGDALIELPSKAYAFWAWTDAVTNVTVPTANSTNPRVDRLVAWVDKTVNTTASANNPGSLKFSIITGTPSASPSAVTDTAVQASLGAAIPWIALAYIYVGAGVTSITSTNITDNRASITSYINAPNIVPNAWQSWTPTFTNMSGGTLSYATYIQVGKLIRYRWSYVLGGAGISGRVYFTTPTSIRSAGLDADIILEGNVGLLDAGNALFSGLVKYSSANQLEVKVLKVDATYAQPGDVTSTVPFTWGTGDRIQVEGSYEAA